MNADVFERVLGQRPTRIEPLGGGAAGTVVRLHLPEGGTLVAKQAPAGLEVEAVSLRLLAERSSLPVPRVVHAEATLLVMQDMPGRTGAGQAQAHAADLLAALHAVTSPDGRYGLDFDNTIGPLPQTNGWADDWPTFFAHRRLLPLAHAAAREGSLAPRIAGRLEHLASRLGEFLPATPPASLLHGDLWSGNILSDGPRVTGLIDPSPYFGHAEVELAFIRLFSTLGPTFELAYREQRGVPDVDWREFERTRCALYNLYPLLVHTRLFGGHYAQDLESSLTSLGL
ncbi:MAG: aminoglycoside phosphotransferase [Phycisphaerae bacterium]|nr:MAG: aminoglycoside phosphotransferase [Phycisphaerae bacterium]